MGTYEIKVRGSFSAAHNLRRYRGKCEKLHGHNWSVVTTFEYETLDRSGMAIDFRKAKEILNGILCKLDHAHLNKLSHFRRKNPTSENIAKFIFDNIELKNKNIKSVEVWEAERSGAMYSR